MMQRIAREIVDLPYGIDALEDEHHFIALISALPTIVTWADGLVGEATVATQPMSIATSNPSAFTKKSRVSAGLSERMLGTARLTVTFVFYRIIVPSR
jgi:hypothetical protein